MLEIIIAKMKNPENYEPWAKKYGVIMEMLPNTAVINWDSNRGGICTNVKHGDYEVYKLSDFKVLHGEIFDRVEGKLVATGLAIL